MTDVMTLQYGFKGPDGVIHITDSDKLHVPCMAGESTENHLHRVRSCHSQLLHSHRSCHSSHQGCHKTAVPITSGETTVSVLRYWQKSLHNNRHSKSAAAKCWRNREQTATFILFPQPVTLVEDFRFGFALSYSMKIDSRSELPSTCE